MAATPRPAARRRGRRGRAGRESTGVPTVTPYLEGATRARFDAWLEGALARAAPLTFQELRKGVRALSSLYVEQRDRGPLGPRVRAGRAKRAAFASYYAALHFLTVRHALDRIGAARLGAVTRVFDLGCGTAAASAAVATALGDARPPVPLVLASDAAGWPLPEARRTLAAFRVAARVRRAPLPKSLPAGRRGDLVVLAWTVNELEAEARSVTLDALGAALARGARILVIESLAGPASPWWPEWADRLGSAGARAELVKVTVERPVWLAKMDRASGLDHRTLGARVLAGPLDRRAARR